jgi:hypothetical protein
MSEKDGLHLGLDVVCEVNALPTHCRVPPTVSMVPLGIVISLVDHIVFVLDSQSMMSDEASLTLSVIAQPSFGTRNIGAIRSVRLKCHRSGIVACV